MKKNVNIYKTTGGYLGLQFLKFWAMEKMIDEKDTGLLKVWYFYVFRVVHFYPTRYTETSIPPCEMRTTFFWDNETDAIKSWNASRDNLRSYESISPITIGYIPKDRCSVNNDNSVVYTL